MANAGYSWAVPAFAIPVIPISPLVMAAGVPAALWQGGGGLPGTAYGGEEPGRRPDPARIAEAIRAMVRSGASDRDALLLEAVRAFVQEGRSWPSDEERASLARQVDEALAEAGRGRPRPAAEEQGGEARGRNASEIAPLPPISAEAVAGRSGFLNVSAVTGPPGAEITGGASPRAETGLAQGINSAAVSGPPGGSTAVGEQAGEPSPPLNSAALSGPPGEPPEDEEGGEEPYEDDSSDASEPARRRTSGRSRAQRPRRAGGAGSS